MAQPLSPLTPSNQNTRTISSITRNSSSKSVTKADQNGYHFEHESENIWIEEPTTTITSSPFVADIDISNRSPIKHRSPTKSRSRSPRKISPPMEAGMRLTEDALRENEGDNGTIQVLEDARIDTFSDEGNDTMSAVGGPKSYAGADDTCFSTFSAVPNTDMTMFARLGQSPTKSNASNPTKSIRPREGAGTPMHSRPTTPGTLRQLDYDPELPSSSPTPRHTHHGDADDSTHLLEFTQDLSQPSPRSRRSSPSKGPHRHPDLTGYPSAHRLRSPTRDGFRSTTPGEPRHLTNLLDFDLPPAPTPRSIPTITARELESLKSSFLSQISSLKATLSGKEAEITSLKGAKDDAEQRVGEALEQVRDLKDIRDDLRAEKENWEKRDKEMQGVLRTVKEEIIANERERSSLVSQTSDLQKCLEEAESRASEAESKVAGLEAASTPAAKAVGAMDNGDVATPGSSSNKAVEIAVEKVARELHGLYKAKHETKVGALKKSYEARWEKRIREMQVKIDELGRENEELRLGRDATMTAVAPGVLSQGSQPQRAQESEEGKVQREAEEKEADEHRVRELMARVEDLGLEVESVRTNNQALRADLETSRAENSELVAAVEQMLVLESTLPAPAAPAPEPVLATVEKAEMRGMGGLGAGMGGMGGGVGGGMNGGMNGGIKARASGLKGPGFGAMGGGTGRFARSTSGSQAAPRSGIMSNIERMGRGRAE
ncbi:hypothetical protein MMC30_009027 [Trapelia coarctata]|nr:hypothetical protein [Trapelia coarctata]